MRIDNEKKTSGRRLVEELDKGIAKPVAAFWMFQEDQNSWKLVVSSKLGTPRKVYREVQKILRKKSDIQISLDEVIVVKISEPILQLMRVMIRTGEGISDINLSGNVVNGRLVPDSHVYRMAG